MLAFPLRDGEEIGFQKTRRLNKKPARGRQSLDTI